MFALSVTHLVAPPPMSLCIMDMDDICGEVSTVWMVGELASVVIFGAKDISGGSIS